MKLTGSTRDAATRDAALAAARAIFTVRPFTRAEVEEIRKLSRVPPHRLGDGAHRSRRASPREARVAGNGLNLLVIEPTPR